MLTLYGIRNCDTVKRARAWLDAQGIAYRFHDYKVAGVEADRLADWVERLGWEALLNRAGTTFRKLPDADKASLDANKATALMLAHPSAIRRPVAQADGLLVAGFSAERYAAAFPTAG
jgi:arsenate reductase